MSDINIGYSENLATTDSAYSVLKSDINSGVATSACKVLNRHLCYLTKEMVPLALFSRKVPAQIDADEASSGFS